MHLSLPSLPALDLFPAQAASTRLRPLDSFGSNPGALNGWFFVPEGTEASDLPLVVVLHGCTQTAAGYDTGSGWSQLADLYGFAVLFPEQRRTNNPNLCFNWFEPGDTGRGAGEALSIAEMIEAMIERHGVNRQRVFITGLSAGGAMTSVMLALYPEMFAGGAVLAGLPHGAAASVQEAFRQMRSSSPTSRASGSSIKQASRHRGPWPAVAIWHGTADTVVSPSNAQALVEQWREVHALDGAPEEGLVDGYPHRAWRDANGRVAVEEYRLTGMGHGTPLATTGECGCGEAGAFMLEVGISSTVHSARTWGLLSVRRERTVDERAVARSSRPSGATRRPPALGTALRAPGADGIAHVIENALRSAGLMQ